MAATQVFFSQIARNWKVVTAAVGVAGGGILLMIANGLPHETVVQRAALRDGTITTYELRANGAQSASGTFRLSSGGLLTMNADTRTGLVTVRAISGSDLFAQKSLRSSGALVVRGPSFLQGALTAGQNTELWGDLTVGGNSNLGADVTIDGNAVFNGEVTATGYTSCTALETDSAGALVCGSDDVGSGSFDQSQTDARYVNTSGDTMTGALTILNPATAQLRLQGATSAIDWRVQDNVDAQIGRGGDNYASLIFANSATFNTSKQWAVGLRPGDSALHFFSDANNAESIIITQAASPLVGIGTTPETRLDVAGTMSGGALRIMHGASYFRGNVGIGTTSPGNELEVAGTMSGRVVAGIARTPAFFVAGTLSTGTNKSMEIPVFQQMRCRDVKLTVKTAPTGQAVIVDINENGTTIFSTRPQINASATTDSNGETINDTVIAAGSTLTIDIDQVGSGTAGADLTAALDCFSSP